MRVNIFMREKMILLQIEDYNSHNTTILDVKGVKNLLNTLPEIKKAFKR